MEGLALFKRTNSKGNWNLASYHSPHSLTWSWILSFSLYRGDEAKVWPIWMPHRTNVGFQWAVRFPFIGILRMHRQRPMWFRDMYRRSEGERERLKDELRAVPRQPTPPRSPFKPTVIEGGSSIH